VDWIEPHRRKLIEAIEPIESEPIVLSRLSRADGRVLSRAALARRAAPPYYCPAMDDYAVRHAEVSAPTELALRQILHAGDSPGSAIGAREALAQAPVQIPEGTGDVQEGERVETWLLGQ
jgi:molybdopterin biosynthesis enzyme